MMTLTRRVALLASIVFASLGQSAYAGLIVGVDFGRAAIPQTTPANWTFMPTAGLGDPVTMSNLIDETGSATSLAIAVESLDSTTTSNALPTFAAGQIPIHTTSLSGLDGNAFNSGDTGVTWSGLTPGILYDLWVFTGDSLALNQTVTITGGGTPTEYLDSGPANTLFINGLVGSSANTLDSFALQVTADVLGEIAIVLASSSTSESAIAGTAIRAVDVFVGVPEPTTMALSLLALSALAAGRFRARPRGGRFRLE